jgi:hypothetical protein
MVYKPCRFVSMKLERCRKQSQIALDLKDDGTVIGSPIYLTPNLAILDSGDDAPADEDYIKHEFTVMSCLGLAYTCLISILTFSLCT